jgi:N-acetylneuraminic acid mutarotase
VSDDALVLVGGKDVGRVFADIYTFAVDAGRWKLLHRLPHGLHSHSAAALDGKLLISGGLDGRGHVVPHFYSYDWRARKR